MIKEADSRNDVQQVCSNGLNLFKTLISYLKPVLPNLARKSEAFLDVADLDWDSAGTPLTGHRIKKFKPLMTRVDTENVDAIVSATMTERSPSSVV